jgi:tRNA-2-methylthio-N6-dimethylallyladenosine synthase
MNVYDSDRIKEIMEKNHYQLSTTLEETGVYIINTCSVREKPRERVIAAIKQAKAKNPKLKVIIAGCVAQLEGDSLLKEGADLVVGPDWYEKIPIALNSFGQADFNPIYDGFIVDNPKFLSADPIKSGVSAFLPIQKGCDNFCTYCVVPLARGPERSRPLNEIIEEVKIEIDRGAKEIFLLGQNVNSYKGEGGFANLLEEITKVDGVKRVRFTTSHPKDLSSDLIEVMARNPIVMPWLHLPVQAGSDSVLKRMGRKYDRDYYLDLVKRIKNKIPQISLTTDMIIGFPGESEDDFQETLTLMDKVGYEGVYSFKYSKRPGTAAMKLDGHLPEEVKGDRLTRLQALHEAGLPKLLERYVGITTTVLVEGTSRRNPNEAKGRIPQNHVINFQLSGNKTPQSMVGDLVEVEISEVRSHTLYGKIIP